MSPTRKKLASCMASLVCIRVFDEPHSEELMEQINETINQIHRTLRVLDLMEPVEFKVDPIRPDRIKCGN